MKIGKYMTVVPVSPTARLTPYQVKDRRGMTLGTFEWYSPWAQYVFSPRDNAVFSHDCLSDLSTFAAELLKALEADEAGNGSK